MQINKKVFLGGTCNESQWREGLIPMLLIEYFNPVVPDWTPECMEEEIKQREVCDYCLYTITPRMMGVYSIAEVVDDSNKRPQNTVLCVLKKDGELTFSKWQMKSLGQVARMVKSNGGQCFDNLNDVAGYLNAKKEENHEQCSK
ncbi:nucleoside 2-deoxyribosyltransferase domain-containing protein [Clostridium sp. E02]|uniref:nucleoside 2-deoxyribosyltransferase domain-containing protein n=1 Tax=Clostridium sp. E02 TaxID=2487134 RepID=UPI000F542C92|nr:nucleoside 2-deoxyribosyltransferase domain-containing protein [Clostridium sp. E02]